MPRTVSAAALLVCLLIGCEITQEHIDQASEKLAEATVATGSRPTQAAIDAAIALRQEHLAGSTWRMIPWDAWPHADAVVTLGTNGRTVWHLAAGELQHLHDRKHWSVTAGAVYFDEGTARGWRVDVDTVCLEHLEAKCATVVQRVTP